MNMIIEIIDGVAYAVLDQAIACKKCAAYNQCDYQCHEHEGKGYRHLTADECVAVQEALVDGVKYLYTFQWRRGKGDRWTTVRVYFPTLEAAKINRNAFLYLNHDMQTRMVRKPIAKWEVVK